MKKSLILRRYDGLSCLEEKQVKTSGNIFFAEADWSISFDGESSIRAKVLKGNPKEVQVSLEFTPENWSEEIYLMLPAAAYKGNRFKCIRSPYPPNPIPLKDMEDKQLVINDVPRLNINSQEPSEIHISTGDETTPCITWFNPEEKKSYFLLTRQKNSQGNFGIRVTESGDRKSAVCALESPVMRQKVYAGFCMDNPSWDKAADLQAGACVEIPYKLMTFDADSIQDHYTHFAAIRKDLTGPVALKHCLPFSAAWKIQERKLNRDNWNEAYGYYAVGTRNCWEGDNHNVGQDWQPGWTGGGINSLPLLAIGDTISRERAMSTLDFMFTSGQANSGLLYGLHHQGKFYNDAFRYPTPDKWVMIRKNADALYFALKHLIFLRDNEEKIPETILAGVKKLADCLQKIHERYGEFGQFVDVETAEMLLGGTLSGAMGSGALALAGEFFEEPSYIGTAVRAAKTDYENHIKKGLTTGGPGDMLQAPDSESAFAMLESLIVLYEVTGERCWLSMAEETADQCMTWCASYDYEFPKDSCFGEKDIRAAGSVWANVQNKHSSPSICTFSGDSLFKLYRATGQKRFLELITETAHNLPQYMVREDYQLGNMKEGWICERVNFSDWEGVENIGGNLFGSCWPEVSLALTVIEIPGLYVQTDTKFICPIDHIDARIIEEKTNSLIIELSNTTNFDAEVGVLAEDANKAQNTPLGQMEVLKLPTVLIPSGEKVHIQCSSDGTALIV